MNRLSVLLIVGLCAATGLFAQSNEFVDNLLSNPSVSLGQVSYLVLVASDNLGEDADEVRAFELLGNLGWAPPGMEPSDPVNLRTYAFMLMRAFGLKGGYMYRLFPGPRYAYRELASLQVIQGKSDPLDPVEGATAVRMLGRVFDVLGVK
jgi:hypothetical protein